MFLCNNFHRKQSNPSLFVLREQKYSKLLHIQRNSDFTKQKNARQGVTQDELYQLLSWFKTRQTLVYKGSLRYDTDPDVSKAFIQNISLMTCRVHNALFGSLRGRESFSDILPSSFENYVSHKE